MTAYFHASPSRNRASILRDGLEPRDTTRHHFEGESFCLDGNRGVEAVYVHSTETSALEWVSGFPYAYDHEPMDVWQITVGDPDSPPEDDDPHWSDARRLHGHVPPWRLRLLHEGLAAEDADAALCLRYDELGCDVPF